MSGLPRRRGMTLADACVRLPADWLGPRANFGRAMARASACPRFPREAVDELGGGTAETRVQCSSSDRGRCRKETTLSRGGWPRRRLTGHDTPSIMGDVPRNPDAICPGVFIAGR